MRCPKCHFENNQGSRFCSLCGVSLDHQDQVHSLTQTAYKNVSPALGDIIAGRYKIIEELGKGGMGKVYKAEDSEINEVIALKLLNPEISEDKEVIERFKNELIFARRINHKNVCRMYHLGKDKTRCYITMEYVAGEDLKSIIKMMGFLSTGKAIWVAKQVCEGLGEAHRSGIVHRDLKPQNIMIDKEGKARIMDFGIARSIEAKGFTATGMMIGTPEYMSPEQAEGRDIDHRSDIYSLGIILYEMLTGEVPFPGDAPLSVALKHKSEIPASPRTVNPHIPENLEQLILKCLEKRKDKRFQNIDELLADLTRIEKNCPPTSRLVAKRKPFATKEITVTFRVKKLILPGILLAILLIFAAIAGINVIGRFHKVPAAPAVRQLTFAGNAYLSAISPDGKFIAYASRTTLNEASVTILDLGAGQEAEVMQARSFRSLRWSPESSTLALWADSEEHGTGIFLIPRLGGSPRGLGTDHEFLAWSPDASRLACGRSSSKIIRFVDKITGDSSDLALSGDFTLIQDLDWSTATGNLLILTTDDRDRYAIWTIAPEGRKQQKVIEENVPIFSPRWSRNGEVIYYLTLKGCLKELKKISVLTRRSAISTSPSVVLTGIQMGNHFTLSQDGRKLLATRDFRYSNLWEVAIGRGGNDGILEKKPLTKGTLLNIHPSISPDGKWIAFVSGDCLGTNIFILPFGGGIPRQVTFENSAKVSPAWSPDGEEIAFGSNQGGVFKVWKIDVRGKKPYVFKRSQLNGDTPALAWSPGRKILYQNPGNHYFHLLDPGTENETRLFKDDAAGGILYPCYSPDGKRVAVYWNRPPSAGLWIITIADDSRMFLREGTDMPIGWSADSRWVYTCAPEEGFVKILSVSADGRYEKNMGVLSMDSEKAAVDGISYREPYLVLSIRVVNVDTWLFENFDPEIK